MKGAFTWGALHLSLKSLAPKAHGKDHAFSQRRHRPRNTWIKPRQLPLTAAGRQSKERSLRCNLRYLVIA